ncbi:ROK family transcriptional regulator [Nonomuraea rosea]|uniref:ROK family transcriptional regulator n=1 Tax=Nonomuraea rosea TaxID=638574 RepID=A0ABP6ZHV4_9ACTN
MIRPQRGTSRDVRRTNRAVLLRRLFFDGERSRFELAQATGLSPATVSNVVTGLLSDGIAVEVGRVESDGGRPRVQLRVNADHAYAVGVEVGETRVGVELFDLSMTPRAKAETPLRPGQHTADLVAGHIREGVAAVIAQAGVDPGRVLGVGVGVPGMVRGSVVDSPTFGWSGVRLADMLPGPPVFVDNGAMTLGLAEHWFGAGRDSDYMIMVLIGSGVGACIITDGITVRGASGGAGEWGHTTVVAGGRPCRCGARGCLEAYVGAESVLARAGIDLAGTEEEGAFAELLADPGARPLFDEVVGHLGAGLASLINLLNPERIVLGGWAGLLLARDHLPAILTATERSALRCSYDRVAIEAAHLGPEGVKLGAATLVVDQFLGG